jgi:hypothetical protein
MLFAVGAEKFFELNNSIKLRQADQKEKSHGRTAI